MPGAVVTDPGLLLLADRVWDGVADEATPAGFVAVVGDRITAVGRQAEIGSALDGLRRVDLAGATLMPGLVNAHVHLGLSGSEDPVADYLADAEAGHEVLRRRALANLAEAVAVGVTTVQDLGTVDEVAFPVRDRAADPAAEVLPRVLTSGRPITSPGGHCHWFSHECAGEQEVRAAVDGRAAAGADVVKVFATGGNLTPGTDPFSPQFSQAELDVCVARARAAGLRVAAHAHAPEGIRRAVKAGVTTIEHCMFETAGGVEYDPATAEAMAAAGIAVCPTVGATILDLLAAPAEALPPVAQRLQSRIPQFGEVFRRLVADGVRIVNGSDAGGIPHRRFGHGAADVGMLHRFVGMPVPDALRAATSVAADVLGLGDTGRLVVGCRADVLAVDGDPLSDITDLTRTRLVAVGGRLLADPAEGFGSFRSSHNAL